MTASSSFPSHFAEMLFIVRDKVLRQMGVLLQRFISGILSVPLFEPLGVLVVCLITKNSTKICFSAFRHHCEQLHLLVHSVYQTLHFWTLRLFPPLHFVVRASHSVTDLIFGCFPSLSLFSKIDFSTRPCFPFPCSFSCKT